jgi:hypothetical protein
MENEMRKLIDQVKNFGKLLNEANFAIGYWKGEKNDDNFKRKIIQANSAKDAFLKIKSEEKLNDSDFHEIHDYNTGILYWSDSSGRPISDIR